MEFGLYGAKDIKRSKIYSFGGLNRTRKGNRNEFSDMYNMSNSEYPCIAPCGGRETIASFDEWVGAVVAPDGTNCDDVTGVTGVVDGGFYYNGVLKSAKYKLSRDWAWQIEQKGNMYIINGYDKTEKKSILFYYNIDTDDFAEGGKVMRNLIVTCGDNYFSTPIDDNNGVYQYYFTRPDGTVVYNSEFYEEYRDYTRDDNYGNTTMVYEKNIFAQFFKVGDEVSIEGFCDSNNGGQIWNITSGGVLGQPNITAIRNNTVDTDNMTSTNSLRDNAICRAVITGFSVRTSNGLRSAHEVYFKLYNKNGAEVTFRNLKDGGFYCTGVTLKKRTRVFDRICVHHGRIWGAQPSGNQIYASPSDNIFSFTAQDVNNRYGVRIPSDTAGAFTALCSYNNELIAFKPDSLMVVAGTNPVNYNTYVISGIGCIAPKSVAVTPEGVLFLSYGGFYIYNGGVPQCISTKLNTLYTDAVAGFDGTSYYVSALRSDGVRELLVYNMRYGVWYKEDDIGAVGFFRFHSGFYIADGSGLYKMHSGDAGDWSFTFMPCYDNTLDNKGINEIWIRAELSEGSEFRIETRSSDGEFSQHQTFDEAGLRNFRCPVRLKMSEDYQVRVSGHGKVVFYEFEIIKPDGGRRYKA